MFSWSLPPRFQVDRMPPTLLTPQLSWGLPFSWIWGALHPSHVGVPPSLLRFGGTQPLGEPLLPEGGTSLAITYLKWS